MTNIDAALVQMITDNDRRRAERAQATIDGLSPRERELTQAATGAGYRQGIAAGQRGDFDIPTDSTIVAMAGVPFDRIELRLRELTREAAVMAYVRGVMASRGGDGDPCADEDVFRFVVACCQSIADLYPLLGGDLRDVIVALVDRWHLTDRAQILVGAAALANVEADVVAEALHGLVDDETLTDDGTTVGRTS